METTTLSVQNIPVTKIMSNAGNPRHVITQQMVDVMAVSLKSAGLKNPVKVRPNQDGTYVLISGHIRLEGAKKLGWATISTLVMEITPEQALLEAILDNRGQQMTWLDLYLSIEAMMKGDPDLTQQEVGDQLEIPRSVVSRALKVLGLLNPVTRQAICQNLTKSEDYQVSENAAFRLTDLGDAQKIEESLKVVIGRNMTEPQVKRLVAWVKGDNTPESYSPTKAAQVEETAPSQLDETPGSQVQEISSSENQTPEEDAGQTSPKAVQQAEIATPQNEPIGSAPSDFAKATSDKFNDGNSDAGDPLASFWNLLPPQVQVTLDPEGYEVRMRIPSKEVVPAVYGAMSHLEYAKGLSGEKEDTKYRDALTQFYLDNAKSRNKDKAADSGTSGGVKNTLGRIGQAIQKKTGLDPQSIKEGVVNAAERDAKSAANTVVKQYMRKFLKNTIMKDLF